MDALHTYPPYSLDLGKVLKLLADFYYANKEIETPS